MLSTWRDTSGHTLGQAGDMGKAEMMAQMLPWKSSQWAGGSPAKDASWPRCEMCAHSGLVLGWGTLSCAEGCSCSLSVFIGLLHSFLLEWPKNYETLQELISQLTLSPLHGVSWRKFSPSAFPKALTLFLERPWLGRLCKFLRFWVGGKGLRPPSCHRLVT